MAARSRLILAALAVFALLGSAAIAAKHRSASRTYSTGAFVVTCTSTGQVCSPPEHLRLTPPRRGTISTIRYTTSPQHCSAFVLQVVRNGKLLASSGRIEAGEQTAVLHPHIRVPKGGSTIGFRAKGIVGGCNTGRVGSWGGKATVTVKLS